LLYQPIYDIAELCALKGLSQAVLCPGSRCAPLTLAFTRHEHISTKTVSDERSAAFIALGIAQQTHMPVILVCTSGSAAYNFAPAVAEAYYQQIPLVIFSADRPTAWIDQLDGQTIRQHGIYGGHVKKSYTLPEDYDHPDTAWYINRTVNEAINLAMEFPRGPVHVNAPFREPLYPPKQEVIQFSKKLRTIDRLPYEIRLPEHEREQLSKTFASTDKILLVAGQEDYNERLLNSVERFIKEQRVACVGDVISNFHGLPATVRYADSFLAQGTDKLRKTLQPELLITLGKSIISKNVKLFLRQFKPREHWHIQEAGQVADTFQSITKVIPSSPMGFFEAFLHAPKKGSTFEAQKRDNYFRLWEAEEHRTERSMQSFFSTSALSELHLLYEVLKSLPPRCNLHLANSMSVRYANFIGLEAGKKGIHVFANRGTSGIDGCTSAAVGHTLSSDVPNFLITGDMAFFYDRNAFWHNYALPNLRVIVLNNHGGSIFNMIDGPGDLPEKEEYFVTRQSLTAKNLAAEFGFDYLNPDSFTKLKGTLSDFYQFDGKTKILEIDTTADLNKGIFEQFKKYIKKGYE
jgi:2-succinyl-5-enolpyruvyl-6-hydroxy-3-cyclohexene-1-carboxylate synthase